MSSPSFQFYPKQWLGDDRVMLMDWDARAMHFHLMLIAWQQPVVGTIPDDDFAMRRWCGNPKDWARLKPQILSAWRLDGNRWHQDGLVREHEKQTARRQRNAANGSKGGRPRSDESGSVLGSKTETETKPTTSGGGFEKDNPSKSLRARASSSSTSTSVSKPSESNDSSGQSSDPEKVRKLVDCSCKASKPLVPDAAAEDVVPEFLTVFANCKTDAAQNRNRGTWLGVLRDMRAQRHAWEAIWQAFALTHGDSRHAPIRDFKGPWSNLRALGSERTPVRRAAGTFSAERPTDDVAALVESRVVR